MLKRIAVLAALPLLAVPALAQTQTAVSGIRSHHRQSCPKRFTVAMTKRAADVSYGGTRKVSRHNVRMLGHMEKCQRNPRARWFVRWYDHRQAARHRQRVFDAAHPWSGDELATEYDDSGPTASGAHYSSGFASCGSEGVECGPMGQHVQFCLVDGNDHMTGDCIDGYRQDNGPYGGAAFDFNMNMGAAFNVGGPGHVTVRWRVVP